MKIPDRMPTSVIARHSHPGRSFWLLGLLIVALALSQVPVFAQFASGSIGATVTDATGAVVPAAKVVLKNEATGALRDSVTNSAGAFDFPSILPATYTLTITAAGLQTFEEQGITLTQGSTLRLPTIILQVQSTKQEVEVVAGADVVVPVDSGQSSQTLNKSMIENISLSGRDAAELIKIMPGMGHGFGAGPEHVGAGIRRRHPATTGLSATFPPQGAPLYGGVTMTSDGANLLDPGNQGTQTANINQNQVQEVSILTSAYGAEFAKGPVTFQAIGKSGGAQFHGRPTSMRAMASSIPTARTTTARECRRRRTASTIPAAILAARSSSRIRASTRTTTSCSFTPRSSIWNSIRPAACIATSCPRRRCSREISLRHILPALGPAFASTMSAQYRRRCPYEGGNGSGTSFPGGQIPQSQLDPNSAAILKLMPTPNADPANESDGLQLSVLRGTAGESL